MVAVAQCWPPPNAPRISSSSSSGLVVGAKRARTRPSLAIRNLVKFHLMAVVPSTPLAELFRNAKTGASSDPFTSTLASTGNVTPKLSWQNCWISASVPGSWPPNWLQGNPITVNPWSLNFL